MTTLQERRHALGADQRKIAFLLGTSDSNLSTYESGRKKPGRRVSERLAALELLTAQAEYLHWNALHTMASLAVQIRSDLRRGDADYGWFLKQLGYTLSLVSTLDAEQQRFLLIRPSTTGSIEWDTLLAGAAQHFCDTHGLPRPSWTQVKPLAQRWCPFLEMEPWLWRKAPEQLKALNIAVDEGSLSNA